MGLFHELNKKGNTIIVVTHEDDIAHYAHRIIKLNDGLVSEDAQNNNVKRYQPEG